MKLAALLMILLLTISFPMTAGGEGTEEHDIGEGNHLPVSFEKASKDYEIKYDIESISGGEFDVYVMSSSQYEQNYENDKDFTAVKTHQNVAGSLNDLFKVPDDKIYYVVIDNKDNAKEDDAHPEGDITVDAYIRAQAPEDDDEGDFEFLMTPFCIVSLALTVIFTLFLQLFHKKYKRRS